MTEEGDKARQGLEADLVQLREGSEAKDQMIREQQDKGKRHLTEKQRLEAAIKESQAKLEQMTEEMDKAIEHKGTMDAFKIVNIMKTLRREASLRCEHNPIRNVKELENLPLLIERDNEIKSMLKKYRWITPYMGPLKDDLAWIAIMAEYEQKSGSQCFHGLRTKVEARIAGLIDDSLGNVV